MKMFTAHFKNEDQRQQTRISLQVRAHPRRCPNISEAGKSESTKLPQIITIDRFNMNKHEKNILCICLAILCPRESISIRQSLGAQDDLCLRCRLFMFFCFLFGQLLCLDMSHREFCKGTERNSSLRLKQNTSALSWTRTCCTTFLELQEDYSVLCNSTYSQ